MSLEGTGTAGTWTPTRAAYTAQQQLYFCKAILQPAELYAVRGWSMIANPHRASAGRRALMEKERNG
jgi:hypothetical protein